LNGQVRQGGAFIGPEPEFRQVPHRVCHPWPWSCAWSRPQALTLLTGLQGQTFPERDAVRALLAGLQAKR